jgi:hypothetical protein
VLDGLIGPFVKKKPPEHATQKFQKASKTCEIAGQLLSNWLGRNDRAGLRPSICGLKILFDPTGPEIIGNRWCPSESPG